MNIAPFATKEEALEWGNQFAAAITKGVEIHSLLESNSNPDTPRTILTADHPNDYVIHQIQRATAVLALIRQSLAEIIPCQGQLIAEGQTWHFRTIDAATFMLESVEDELSSACVMLLPTDELHKMTQEKMGKAGKKNATKK